MSCVPCLECGGGAGFTRENLDRWTDSIANVLASTEGRLHFKRYLESRSLDESLNTIEFWERCSRVMPKTPDGGDSPPPMPTEAAGTSAESLYGQGHSSYFKYSGMPKSRTSPPGVNVSENLHRNLQHLVEYADAYMNFDLAQMRSLYKMLKMTEESEVAKILVQAKQSALELLSDDYQLFREHLLKSRGLLNK